MRVSRKVRRGEEMIQKQKVQKQEQKQQQQQKRGELRVGCRALWVGAELKDDEG